MLQSSQGFCAKNSDMTFNKAAQTYYWFNLVEIVLMCQHAVDTARVLG